jgi:hypothetical protein
VVRAFGNGSQLWRVTVMFDAAGATADSESLVTRLLENLSEAEGDADSLDVRPGACWDIIPPGGALGADMWVQADTVGEAADLGLGLVEAEIRALAGPAPSLWDVRVLPRESITLNTNQGQPYRYSS